MLPMTLVLTASSGNRSSNGTCFNAAVWNTTSGFHSSKMS